MVTGPRLALALALATSAGCGDRVETARVAPAGGAEIPLVRRLGQAWEIVAGGTLRRAATRSWYLERSEDGAIVVRPRAEPPPLVAMDDDAIGAVIRAHLAAMPAVEGARLSVEVERGVVRLSGTVDTMADAALAVRTALVTPGVREVITRLGWEGIAPTRR